MRQRTEKIYGIPPEQMVCSSGVATSELCDGKPVLIKEARVEFIDDGTGKPVGIKPLHRPAPDLCLRQPGRRPADAAIHGRRQRPRLPGLVHHTDGVREYAYDRQSPIGKLDKAFDEALNRQWSVVDMKTE